MLQRIGYDIELEVSSPTTLVAALLVRPEFQRDLREPEAVVVTPDLHVERYLDTYGNRCMRIAIPAGVEAVRLTLDTTAYYSGETDVITPEALQHPVHELPSSVLQFLLSSRYCEVDSELMQPAGTCSAGSRAAGPRSRRSATSCTSASPSTTSAPTPGGPRSGRIAIRSGVCRDFAHLALTLCRCLNIPARYVNGYLGDIGIDPLPPPMDFSAWFEVYLGDRWYAFDARHNIPRMARLNIAHGRDATDVPITMVFGPHQVRRFDVTAEAIDDGGRVSSRADATAR